MATKEVKELAEMGHAALDEVERLLTREAELEAQLADLKERSDIMDAVHKEAMEKLGRYRKALEEILGNDSTEGPELIDAAYECIHIAREALAVETETPTKGVEK